jgi:hypothetical protein
VRDHWLFSGQRTFRGKIEVVRSREYRYQQHDGDPHDRDRDDRRCVSGVRQPAGSDGSVGAVVANRPCRCRERAEQDQHNGDRTPAPDVTELLDTDTTGDDGQRRSHPCKKRALIGKQKSRISLGRMPRLVVSHQNYRLPAGVQSTSPPPPAVAVLA